MSDNIEKLREVFAKERGLHQAYRRLFSSPDGQVVLKHLCKRAHVNGSTFVAGDPHMTSHNEGKRHIVLSILRYINKNEDDLMRQIQETMTDD